MTSEHPRAYDELPPEAFASGNTWQLAWCLDCTPPNPDGTLPPNSEMPFATHWARGVWLYGHLDETGHSTWRLLEVPRTEHT